jgi:hypothetical protein
MFSLRSLFLIVAVAGLGAAAFVYPTGLWASVIVTVTLGVFVFALLRIYSHPERRMLWVPTAVIGWFCVALWLWQPVAIREYLPTTRIVFALWESQFGSVSADPFGNAGNELFFISALNFTVVQTDPKVIALRVMWTVSHCLFALVIAFGGGAIYSWSVTRNRGRN